ncbi:MAG TPA: AAA family ATPase, partial [Desulfatirhabdiaceae bacterium]|nr:AAA family ATPase [Desulfatirhabdiaceae bacterium]
MRKKSGRKKRHPLIQSLMNPQIYDHPVKQCRLIETHISWVILTGTYAYKLKKPLDLGFLDFSSLGQRHFFCEEELRLNRRLAPNLYLSVESITGSIAHPQWNGPDEPIEYAVKMAEFSQNAQMDRMLAKGRLKSRQIDALAQMVSDFHQQATVADSDQVYGNAEQAQKPVMDNFSLIRKQIACPGDLCLLDELEHWTQSTIQELIPVFARRKADNRIRECHGDLHLKNLAWLDHAPVAFDCIEFNPNLRWIDVINDAAFLVMDLLDRARPDLAWRFLNRYLETGGDYDGVSILKFYIVYRALVRAKIHAIRMGQPGISSTDQILAERACHDYLCLACKTIQPSTPALIITHGPSASGKSTLTQPLLEQLGAIRIRSDVERKRIHGIDPSQSAGASQGQGIYSDKATRRTFDHLAKLAGLILDAGYPVIVDAAFLDRHHRKQFEKLAVEKRAGYIILDFKASPNGLRRRIA